MNPTPGFQWKRGDDVALRAHHRIPISRNVNGTQIVTDAPRQSQLFKIESGLRKALQAELSETNTIRAQIGAIMLSLG